MIICNCGKEFGVEQDFEYHMHLNNGQGGKHGRKSGAEVQKWADKAMFAAEPLKASDGPKVYLVWMTPDPLGAVAAMAKMYKGEVVRSLADVTHAERKEYLEQILKTKLKAPLEAVKLHFMIEGVTRSFTHQMVRQRTAVYAQESLRFAVKEDMEDGVSLPPSLQGTTGEEFPGAESTKEEWQRNVWDHAVREINEAYQHLVASGMPAEDARGLLPHNITTRLNYVTDLRALLDHAGNRLCTQAQFEWRLVFAKIIEAIRDYKPHQPFRDGLDAQWGRIPSFAVEESNERDSWQFKALSEIFKPVCYATGKCEFMADFDRACSIRDRVQANHSIGRPSSEWHKPVDVGMPGIARQEGMMPWSYPVPDDTQQEFIPAISVHEWLTDPGAAR